MMKKCFAFLMMAVMVTLGMPTLAAAQQIGESQINEERMLAEYLDMLRTRSQGKNERAFADSLKERLSELGGEVSEDEAYKAFGGNAGNVFAYFKGNIEGAPVMMLNAHIDTVEPSEGVEPQIVDGVIKPSGKTILGADDKTGVACIIEALRTIEEKDIPHADILVVLTVAEDAGLLGSKNINQELLQQADFGFSLDGSGKSGDIFYTAIGANQLKIVIEGKAAHAGNAPEKGVNAIAIAGKGLAKLVQGRIDEETTSNVGTIKGGVATNIIADRCEMMAEARSRSAVKLAQQTKYIGDTFVQTATENGGKATVTLLPVMEPFNLSMEATPIVLAGQTLTSMGMTPQYRKSGGGSDANFFNAYGVPTAVIAMGNGANHTSDEYMAIEDLYKSGNLVINLIKAAGELRKN